jgi:hypothetical protein
LFRTVTVGFKQINNTAKSNIIKYTGRAISFSRGIVSSLRKHIKTDAITEISKQETRCRIIVNGSPYGLLNSRIDY